jgi:hypothetical protein
LADKVTATYVTSASPFSTVAASACDLDHNKAYPEGPTSELNVTPFDRRWHRAKTHWGFKVKRDPATAVVTWTSPSGLTHKIDPYDYRTGP